MKFKVGDRVKKIGGSHVGEIGTVKKVGRCDYEVEFDNRIPNGHACNCTCKPGYGWFCMAHDLELVKPAHKFKVGDKIRIRKWSDMEKEFGVEGYIRCKCGFTGRMRHLCGRTGTLTYVNGYDVRIEFDDNSGDTAWGYSTDMIESAKPETIVIYQKNETVVAKNTATGEKAVAKCHPDDEFDFKTGATVAFDRLMGREVEKPKFIESFEEGKTYKFDKETYMKFNRFESLYPLHWAHIINGKVVTVESESHGIIPDDTVLPWAISPHWCVEVTEEPKKEEYYNGRVVCIDVGHFGIDLTKGKIYNVVDGYLIDDVGDKRHYRKPPAKSLDDLNKYSAKYCEVVE